MMELNCSMRGCNITSKNNNIPFYEFPRDFDKCMLWVQNCGRDDLTTDFTYEGARAVLNKYICAQHFRVEDFCDTNSLAKELKDSAVPVSSVNDDIIGKSVEEVEHAYNSAEYDCQIKCEFVDMEIIKQEPVPDVLPTEIDAINEEFCDDTSTSTVEFDNIQELEYINCRSYNRLHVNEEEEKDKRKLVNDLTQAITITNETQDNIQEMLRSSNALRTATKRANETPEERQIRLNKNALRVFMKRQLETSDEKYERRRKNAERAALRRKTEPEDKKELRRLKDRIRSAERRKKETGEQLQYRRYIDAVRSALRRYNETDEQRQHRREADIARAARRKLNESNEQREKRLQCDRERSAKRRMGTKTYNSDSQWQHLENFNSDSAQSDCGNSSEHCNSSDTNNCLVSEQEEVCNINNTKNLNNKSEKFRTQNVESLDKFTGYTDQATNTCGLHPFMQERTENHSFLPDVSN